MNTSRHIFLQIDTEKLIALSYAGVKISDELVLAHTFIYKQGAMALGSAVKDFGITAEPGDTLTFTILPLELFSTNTLTFSGFKPLEQEDVSLSCEPFKNQVSFIVSVNEVRKDCLVDFSLSATLEFFIDGRTLLIPISIDPVLRAKQGH